MEEQHAFASREGTDGAIFNFHPLPSCHYNLHPSYAKLYHSLLRSPKCPFILALSQTPGSCHLIRYRCSSFWYHTLSMVSLNGKTLSQRDQFICSLYAQDAMGTQGTMATRNIPVQKGRGWHIVVTWSTCHLLFWVGPILLPENDSPWLLALDSESLFLFHKK